MTQVLITMDLDPDSADPTHPSGVTDEAWMQIFNALSEHGENIEIGQVLLVTTDG